MFKIKISSFRSSTNPSIDTSFSSVLTSRAQKCLQIGAANRPIAREKANRARSSIESRGITRISLIEKNPTAIRALAALFALGTTLTMEIIPIFDILNHNYIKRLLFQSYFISRALSSPYYFILNFLTDLNRTLSEIGRVSRDSVDSRSFSIGLQDCDDRWTKPM